MLDQALSELNGRAMLATASDNGHNDTRQDGEICLHRNMKAAPEPFLKAIAPYREGLVVAVECIFTWY